jgi:hypothetical protein
MKDCFVMFATSRRARGDRQRLVKRCIEKFNENVRPKHPDVPVLIFSDGDELTDRDRRIIEQKMDGPVEFREWDMMPPEDLELPPEKEWYEIKHRDRQYRAVNWFFICGINEMLRGEFEVVCHFHDDSYFLSPIERNFFDRLREEECYYAYRGTYPEANDYRTDVADTLEFVAGDHNIDGMAPLKELNNIIFSNFKVFRLDLLDHELFTKYTSLPEVRKKIWTDRWSDGIVHTALLTKAPEGMVRHWHDFKYGHAQWWTGRYHMALDDTGTFWQPNRWPADANGKVTNEKAWANRRKRASAPKATPRHPIILDAEHRQKAIVAIGDGLGNVIAQTPLVAAVTDLFDEVHVWMPRSRPDLPDLIRDMPGIVSTNVQWIDAFREPQAIFQTWLVAPQAAAQKPKSLLARYASQHPRGTKRNESDVCLDAARKAGWNNASPPPYVGVDIWPNAEVTAGEEPLFGFTTGRLHRPMWRFKEYPPEFYAKVIDILAERYPDARFVHIGWEKDTEIPHDKIIDTRKEGTLRQSMGLLQACSVFCGNDTGLSWAASALKVPTVVVFGPTDPRKCLPPWGAVKVAAGLKCQPCQWRGMGKLPGGKGTCKHECMKELAPKDVATAIISQYRLTGQHRRNESVIPSPVVLQDRTIPTLPPE